MHPRVHPVALIAALSACRTNPAFMLQDDGESSASGTLSSSSSSEAGSSTGAELCEPSNEALTPTCMPAFKLSPLEGFNIANSKLFPADQACDTFSDLRVKRVNDRLQSCPNSCDEPCDDLNSLDVSFVATLDLFEPLLPDEGTCALLWHVGRDNPDPESNDRCLTAGFMLRDDTPAQLLRVAVTFNNPEPDPFAGRPEAPLRMTSVGEFELCDLGDANTCATDFKTETLKLRFGACELDTHQGVVTTGLSVDGARFTLELHNAYSCLDNTTSFYRWWIHRDF